MHTSRSGAKPTPDWEGTRRERPPHTHFPTSAPPTPALYILLLPCFVSCRVIAYQQTNQQMEDTKKQIIKTRRERPPHTHFPRVPPPNPRPVQFFFPFLPFFSTPAPFRLLIIRGKRVVAHQETNRQMQDTKKQIIRTGMERPPQQISPPISVPVLSPVISVISTIEFLIIFLYLSSHSSHSSPVNPPLTVISILSTILLLIIFLYFFFFFPSESPLNCCLLASVLSWSYFCTCSLSSPVNPPLIHLLPPPTLAIGPSVKFQFPVRIHLY